MRVLKDMILSKGISRLRRQLDQEGGEISNLMILALRNKSMVFRFKSQKFLEHSSVSASFYTILPIVALNKHRQDNFLVTLQDEKIIYRMIFNVS